MSQNKSRRSEEESEDDPRVLGMSRRHSNEYEVLLWNQMSQERLAVILLSYVCSISFNCGSLLYLLFYYSMAFSLRKWKRIKCTLSINILMYTVAQLLYRVKTVWYI